jgi:hypothetical protein
MRGRELIRINRLTKCIAMSMLFLVYGLAFGQWEVDQAAQTIYTDPSLTDAKVGIKTTNPIARVHAISGGIPSFYAFGQIDFAVPDDQSVQIGHWDGSTFTERLKIRPDGDVGIGISDPTEKLHIADLGISDGVRIQGSSTTTQVRLYLDNTHLDGGRNYVIQSTAGDVSAGNGNFVIRDATAEQNRFTIESTGDMGIGNTAPSGKLDISENNRNIVFHVADVPFQEFPLPFQNFNFRSSWIEFRHGNDAKALIESHEDDGSLTFYGGHSVTRTMTVNDGKVGIGTTAPISKLEVVNGNIRVTGGSFVDDGTILNSPDYVFNPGYKLESIQEHAEFMWRYKHLPTVSSAEEIRKSGGYNMSERREQILEELEKAHIYIEQLHQRITSLEDKLGKMETAFNRTQ